MKFKIFSFVLLLCFGKHLNSQEVYYEDVFNGGITGAGYDPAGFGDPVNINVYIESGSTIRRAYLFVMGYKASGANLINNTFVFNGTTLELNWLNALPNEFTIFTTQNYFINQFFVFDVSNLINPTQNNYVILPPLGDPSGTSGFFHNFYLFVAYENPLMPTVGAQIILNKQDAQQTLIYPTNISGLLSNNIGFGFNSTHFCNTLYDGSYVLVNGINLGLTGGDGVGEPMCTGVRGEFYYQSNTLYSLGDDTANTTMNGVDALANIESYISDPTNISIEFDYQTIGGAGDKTNPVHQLYLAYSSYCSPFSFTTPNDTTVCQGTQLQLSASGGNPTSSSTTGYEWSPATGLSCTDCPNPVFTADSSMFYTVRVWNNDSCSVVRPLKINVRKAPLWDTLELSASVCGASTGSAALYAFPDNSVVQTWTEVGGSTQSSSNFQNLSGGFHTFYFTDTNGCQSADTTIFIQTTNPTLAQFVATPQSGAAPLNVSFANTSQNATDFLWSVNGAPQGNALTSSVFDTSGTYTVQLVAWQNDPACADTFSLQIAVFDSLIVQIPNVFSPNGDGVNELFTVSANQDVAYDFTIFNRWGNAMTQGKGKILQGTPASLWDGKDATDGSYFLKIEFEQLDGTKINYQGVFQVVR